MALVLFKRVSDSTIPTEAIENGKVLYDYQSKKIFLDEGGVRVTFYDFIGLLTSLTTTAKDTIVNAINELVTKTNTTNTNVGTLANLTTSAKSSLVVATNEVNANVGTLSTLSTVVKTSVVGAINWMMSILLPTTINVTWVMTKPALPVYAQSYYLYNVPFQRADLYNVNLTSVIVLGLAGITPSCSVGARNNNGIQINDLTADGAGYPLQINMTLTKI